jgi:hypothetical protein
VWPSGAARAARAAPSVPPAPPTFSMMICWPRLCDMVSPRMRAIASVVPPAANGTIRVIGRLG